MCGRADMDGTDHDPQSVSGTLTTSSPDAVSGAFRFTDGIQAVGGVNGRGHADGPRAATNWIVGTESG